MENNTKHLNYPTEIVAGWDSGEPIKALCGFERVVVEGQIPSGGICVECAHLAQERGWLIPTRNFTPAQTRAAANGRLVTYEYVMMRKQEW